MPTLLNEPLGALFVHVPKTAGSSISRALRSYAPPATVTDLADLDRLDPDHWLGGKRIDGVEQAIAHNLGMQGQRRSLAMGHARAMDIRKLIGPSRYDGLYSFAVVRNPFDRMASTYHYIRDNPDNGMRPMCLELGFEQFVVYSCLLTVQCNRCLRPTLLCVGSTAK
ncbi:MAG: sulfotransferase family 2 domain-containing protein [Flavobacteriaceae bacterium]|nr:sulfotransferase family 2 domain-containing protein [Flavobacteriaceae bacterium]